MLTTQSPSIPLRIHSLYSELPPNSRRAANLPFFVPRPLPASRSSSLSAPNVGNTPVIPRLINPNQGQGRRVPISVPQLASPRPSPAVILTAEPKPISSSPPLVISLAPARVPRSQRDYQAKMVANLLLTRAGRARPMRCSRRTSFLRTGYQPSRLSMSILAADAEEGEETNFEDDLA